MSLYGDYVSSLGLFSQVTQNLRTRVFCQLLKVYFYYCNRYRSQLLNQRKRVEQPEKNLTEDVPSTTTLRTDLPTKRRRLPTKPEPVKTYKVIKDNESDNKKGLYT